MLAAVSFKREIKTSTKNFHLKMLKLPTYMKALLSQFHTLFLKQLNSQNLRLITFFNGYQKSFSIFAF